MPPSQYDLELAQLPSTYASAVSRDIKNLKLAITGASGSSLIGVGSGGSFTVASLLCSLHEYYTGYVSRPSTPLELISNPTLAASSPVCTKDIVLGFLRAITTDDKPAPHPAPRPFKAAPAETWASRASGRRSPACSAPPNSPASTPSSP